MLHSQKLENHSYHMPLIRHSLLEGEWNCYIHWSHRSCQPLPIWGYPNSN